MGYYRATIAYDGTDFLGFQTQAEGRTVQGTLEAALGNMAGQGVRVSGAGRTDTGVHAVGQIIAFNLAWRHTNDDLLRAFNANLPADVAVMAVAEAENDFHPRFSAVSRQYRYTILNQPLRDVFRRRVAMHVVQPLNVTAMQRASTCLLGTHDFASFGRPPAGNSTVRTVTQIEWSRRDTEIVFEITANAFLYRMVRNIVGTLVQVGLGQLEIGRIKEILLMKKRSHEVVPAAPNGLCLVKVNY